LARKISSPGAVIGLSPETGSTRSSIGLGANTDPLTMNFGTLPELACCSLSQVKRRWSWPG
jgi:hypothetical protein